MMDLCIAYVPGDDERVSIMHPAPRARFEGETDQAFAERCISLYALHHFEHAIVRRDELPGERETRLRGLPVSIRERWRLRNGRVVVLGDDVPAIGENVTLAALESETEPEQVETALDVGDEAQASTEDDPPVEESVPEDLAAETPLASGDETQSVLPEQPGCVELRRDDRPADEVGGPGIAIFRETDDLSTRRARLIDHVTALEEIKLAALEDRLAARQQAAQDYANWPAGVPMNETVEAHAREFYSLSANASEIEAWAKNIRRAARDASPELLQAMARELMDKG